MSSLADTSISMPSLGEVLGVLTFSSGYNSAIVVLGASLLGIACGFIGVFALLRDRSLMVDALSHSTLPGLCIAFILGAYFGLGGKQLWLLLLGASCSGIMGVLFVQFISRFTRLNDDTAIGVVLSSFFGLGVVLLSLIQSLGTGEEGGLSHFIYGQSASMSMIDAYYLIFAAIASILISTFFIKEFRLICFDEGFALSDGWPVSFIDLLMMGIVVLVSVIGLQSVGLLLIVAFLIIPPSAARFWTDKLHSMVVISGFIGGLSGYFGASLSALLPRLPSGAVIVLVAGLIFFISFLFAPKRGVISIIIQRTKLNIRIYRDHVLREVFELVEMSQDDLIKIEKVKLLKSRKNILFAKYLMRDLFSITSKTISFTMAGLELAKNKVRNHRLWEEYLITYADFSLSHVDYSADLAEHSLSPEIVKKLEARLEFKSEHLPRSPHPIKGINE